MSITSSEIFQKYSSYDDEEMEKDENNNAVKNVIYKQEFIGVRNRRKVEYVKRKNKNTTKKRISTEIMVNEALFALDKKSGCSAIAIKRFIMNNFDNFNEKRLLGLIYKYLNKSVAEGKIQQKKRSFRIVPTKKASFKRKTTKLIKKDKDTSSSNGKTSTSTTGNSSYA